MTVITLSYYEEQNRYLGEPDDRGHGFIARSPCDVIDFLSRFYNNIEIKFGPEGDFSNQTRELIIDAVKKLNRIDDIRSSEIRKKFWPLKHMHTDLVTKLTELESGKSTAVLEEEIQTVLSLPGIKELIELKSRIKTKADFSEYKKKASELIKPYTKLINLEQELIERMNLQRTATELGEQVTEIESSEEYQKLDNELEELNLWLDNTTAYA